MEGQGDEGASDSPVPKSGALRNELYELRDWYRARARSTRVASCGRVRVQADGVDVRVVEHDTGRRAASWAGVRLCESPWACAVCAAKVRKRRAAALRELQAWCETNGHGCALITLTIRHQLGDDLRKMREGLARAWAHIQRGPTWENLVSGLMLTDRPKRPKPGQEAAPVYGPKAPIDVGYLRVLEVTYGASGWHAHYHVLCITDRKFTSRVNRETWEVEDECEDIAKRLTIEWKAAIGLELGAKHVPSDKRGVRMDPHTALEYASKLDLEMTDSSDAKKAAAGGLKPFELLRLAKSGGRHVIEREGQEPMVIDAERALFLFGQYETAMHRARLHTASAGLIACWEARIPQGVEVGALHVPAETFDALRDIPGGLSGLIQACETLNVETEARTFLASLGVRWVARMARWRDRQGGWNEVEFGGVDFDGLAAAIGLVYKPK